MMENNKPTPTMRVFPRRQGGRGSHPPVDSPFDSTVRPKYCVESSPRIPVCLVSQAKGNPCRDPVVLGSRGVACMSLISGNRSAARDRLESQHTTG
jgi:hypothetical protein